jgi:hypothetical protein
MSTTSNLDRDDAEMASLVTPETEALPPVDTKRWVIRRKAQIVNAVRNGVVSVDEACRRYKLSIEEFVSWQKAIEAHGLPGLRATRIQDYRESPNDD